MSVGLAVTDYPSGIAAAEKLLKRKADLISSPSLPKHLQLSIQGKTSSSEVCSAPSRALSNAIPLVVTTGLVTWHCSELHKMSNTMSALLYSTTCELHLWHHITQ